MKCSALVPVNRNITRQLEHNALMGSFLLSAWVYCWSCACDIDVHIKIYSTSQKGETCFTWYSHSAVFRDPVYSGWTPWLAAQKEAEDTVGVCSCSRQTIVHTRQWCHNISRFWTCSTQSRWYCRNNIRLFGSAVEHFFVCLDANWEGWLTEEESKPSFKSCSTSLLYVSWLFGTLTVKAKVFFVHRYWFRQLFLSKCFYSALFFFLSERLDTTPRYSAI